MSSFEGNWAPPPPPNTVADIDHGQFAGFWLRIFAGICDQLNTAVVTLPASVIATQFGVSDEDKSFIVGSITLVLLVWWTGKLGGSPLRRQLGVFVVDARDGSFIGIWRALGREISKSLIACSFILALIALFLNSDFAAIWMIAPVAFLWMIWDKKRQTLYDRVFKSVVVRR